MNKAFAVSKAAAIKVTMNELETAIDAGDLASAKTASARLHAKLNGLAHKAADFFGGTVSEFSGGTDKPADPS